MRSFFQNFQMTLLTAAVLYAASSQVLYAQEDMMHFSKVFNRAKPYRIFLPADYHKLDRHYPVIYYFHGNTGDHKLDIPGISGLVNANGVILVAWNGRSEESDLRPYNIGNHSNIKYNIQFRDYFPELVDYIDKTYRTIPDRSARGVIGHSMGGIMSFFLAGQYPDLICAAFSSKGSPEFFIGTPARHTLYQVRNMFKNLIGIKTGFATSTECELYYLNNEDINGALNEKDLDFRLFRYEGSHDITPKQFSDAFEFVAEAFRNPEPAPERWHHADIYPDFRIWGYEVESNLNEPGFIDMKGVTRGGFGISTKSWEPDGKPLKGVNIRVKTAPLYSPNTVYTILDYSHSTGSAKICQLTSDKSGRITVDTDNENHQIGIFRKKDPPEIVFIKHNVNDKGSFLDQKDENSLNLTFLNRGGSKAEKVLVTLSTDVPGVSIANPVIELGSLPSCELKALPQGFKITARNKPPSDGSPFMIRFNLAIRDGKNRVWKDEFDVPVFFDVPEFTHLGIDDGDSEVFGSGNGNNIAEPGETVMIYEISNGSKRLRLYYDDPYIDGERLYDEIQPDKWGDGYSLSSLIHISDVCPPGHKIRFLACYEVKDWQKIRRDVTWGTFTLTVGGELHGKQ